MTIEQVLDEVVRAWAQERLAGDARGVDRAVTVARAAYSASGSITKACDQARVFAASWSQHPAHLRADDGRRVVRLAS